MALDIETIEVTREVELDYVYHNPDLETQLADTVEARRASCVLAGQCALVGECTRREVVVGDGTSPSVGLFGMGAGPTVDDVKVKVTDNSPDCPQPNAFLEVAQQFAE